MLGILALGTVATAIAVATLYNPKPLEKITPTSGIPSVYQSKYSTTLLQLTPSQQSPIAESVYVGDAPYYVRKCKRIRIGFKISWNCRTVFAGYRPVYQNAFTRYALNFNPDVVDPVKQIYAPEPIRNRKKM